MDDHSRALLLGARAAGVPGATLRSRLEGSTVTIGVDTSLRGSLLTARVLVTTLRRLPVQLVLDPAGLSPGIADELSQQAKLIDPRRGLVVGGGAGRADVQLHVGLTATTPRTIRLVPDGYGGHVVRDGGAEIHLARDAHPLGSIFTAALAAGEAFKDVAGVLDRRRVDHPHLQWCPVALTSDLTVARLQTRTLTLRLTLAGCGAIGTAIGLILQELDAEGEILLVDRERFGRENLATYSLGGEAAVRGRPWKVNLVRRHLQRYRVQTLHTDIEELPGMVDRGAVGWPRLVLAGLDSPEARRALQRLWPDRLIDGGTSDTAVALHDVIGEDGPCLMCLLPPRSEQEIPTRVAQLTGIDPQRLARGDEPLRPEELAAMTAEQQRMLAPLVNKPVCGLARALGLVASDGDGYQPAVPFVAQQAACLVVGRLLASTMGMVGLPNSVQYDALIGPRQDASDHRRAAPACYCQERSALIRAVREARRKARGPSA